MKIRKVLLRREMEVRYQVWEKRGKEFEGGMAQRGSDRLKVSQ